MDIGGIAGGGLPWLFCRQRQTGITWADCTAAVRSVLLYMVDHVYPKRGASKRAVARPARAIFARPLDTRDCGVVAGRRAIRQPARRTVWACRLGPVGGSTIHAALRVEAALSSGWLDTGSGRPCLHLYPASGVSSLAVAERRRRTGCHRDRLPLDGDHWCGLFTLALFGRRRSASALANDVRLSAGGHPDRHHARVGHAGIHALEPVATIRLYDVAQARLRRWRHARADANVRTGSERALDDVCGHAAGAAAVGHPGSHAATTVGLPERFGAVVSDLYRHDTVGMLRAKRLHFDLPNFDRAGVDATRARCRASFPVQSRPGPRAVGRLFQAMADLRGERCGPRPDV